MGNGKALCRLQQLLQRKLQNVRSRLPHSWDISQFLSPSLKLTAPSSLSPPPKVVCLRLDPRPPASIPTDGRSPPPPPAAVRRCIRLHFHPRSSAAASAPTRGRLLPPLPPPPTDTQPAGARFRLRLHPHRQSPASSSSKSARPQCGGRQPPL
jgi:hypothetical protein